MMAEPALDVAKLRILHYPDDALRTRGRDVSLDDDRLPAIIDRMIELMREAKGVGLAAPQVGLAWRLFVTNAPEDGEPRVYINPALTLAPGEREISEEGCLSIPDVHVEISRPIAASIIATDRQGERISREASGFTARIWQHEFDHLNGLLIIDKMSPLDRIANRKKLRELEGG